MKTKIYINLNLCPRINIRSEFTPTSYVTEDPPKTAHRSSYSVTSFTCEDLSICEGISGYSSSSLINIS